MLNSFPVMKTEFLCKGLQFSILKFIYSEKATKLCEISTVDLIVTALDKSTVEIPQKIVAFSEYVNFNKYFCQFYQSMMHFIILECMQFKSCCIGVLAKKKEDWQICKKRKNIHMILQTIVFANL